MALHLHRAERTDLLADGLGALLADPQPDPFAQELVLVAARGVERWLSQRLSLVLGCGPGRADGVCAGIAFRNPQSLIAEITGTLDDDPWSPEALAWPLLAVIDASLDEPWCRTLASHLGHFATTDAEAELRRGRRYSVARRLAGLFASYARQRPGLLAAWLDGDLGELPGDLAWQPPLWRALVTTVGADPPHVRHDKTIARLRDGPADLPARLSLFGHTRLACTDVQLLDALAVHHDLHLWLPHPSDELWRALAGFQGADGLLPRRQDTSRRAAQHPLLETLGRDVRELQRALPAARATDEFLGATTKPDTLLGWLQADIAGNAPRPAGRSLSDADRSVQVHACHGPARQIDVLREVLLGLLEDDPTLQPRDIVVMCPDIDTYAPLIVAGFGLGEVAGDCHPAHRLRVRLADRALTQTNPLLSVAAELLTIAETRATASQLLNLAQAAPVRAKFGFADDDLDTITTWVRESNIRWGFDPTHRRRYGLDTVVHNTWRFGLDRILTGVAMSEDSQAWLDTALPLDDVGSNRVELAGRLAEFVERLHHVVGGLSGARPLVAWLDALATGIDLLTACNDGWQRAQVQREFADVLARAGSRAAPLLRLPDVRALLDAQLAGRPTRANFRTGTLTVCTMVPMRSVPHRVVCLVGLDDGVFPRLSHPDGDDVLAREPMTGERDIRSEDRQLLLDAIGAATQTLVITYTGADERTGQPRPPAVPLAELLDALDQTTSAPVRERILVTHPLQPFDRKNVTPGALLGAKPFTFDPAALAAAQAAAGKRCPPTAFISGRLPAPPAADVTLADLLDFFKDPVKGFFRALDYTLPWDVDTVEDSIPVQVDALAEWTVGERMLRDMLRGLHPDDAAHSEWRRGTLPPGRLGVRRAKEIRNRARDLAAAALAHRDGHGQAHDVDVDLGDGRRLSGTVTPVFGGRTVSVTYSKLAPKHVLPAWIGLVTLAAQEPGREWSALCIGRSKTRNHIARRLFVPPPDPVIVLVDEFQDTDPMQWRVLERAFSRHSALILIGDPKQAIYGFRGGDIHTYLKAAGTADARYTLGVNWRSDRALVESLQTVLRDATLGHADIVVRGTDAHHAGHRLASAPRPAPFRLRVVKRHTLGYDGTAHVPIEALRRHIPDDLAADVAALLASGATFAGRPVVAADIAVIVEHHKDARACRNALAEAGIPAIYTGDTDVFASQAAKDWLCLLEAFDAPQRSGLVRAAACTMFFGETAESLAAEGDALTDRVAGTLREWADHARHRGVAAVFQAAQLAGMGRRVLSQRGGERDLTDLAHIAQLLHEAAHRERLGLPGLRDWLRRQAKAGAGPPEHNRRLDSDAAAVQIMTVFVAKGLQFPIVYLPFAFNRNVRSDDILLYHDDGTRCLYIGGKDGGAQRRTVEGLNRVEAAHDNLRLTYVALTRAQSQVVAWWAPTFDEVNGGLSRLLRGRRPGQSQVPDRCTPRVTDEQAWAVFAQWEAAGGPSVEESVIGARSSLEKPVPVPGFEVRHFHRRIDTTWRRTSYSDLVRGSEAVTVTSEPAAGGRADEVEIAVVAAPGSGADLTSPLAALPSGASFGSLVHAVLETADPAAPDLAAELEAQVRRHAPWWTVDVDHAQLAPELARALLPMHDTPLGPAAAALTLRQIGVRDRLRELDFEMPLAGGDLRGRSPDVSLADVGELLASHLPGDDPLSPYADRLGSAGLGDQPLRGYLAGSIDVVLRLPGQRYLVVDYKTNHLGDTAADYGFERLTEAMLHSDYPLQALLYVVVLHRFLRWRQRDYAPARHLGGVLYLFVRGMCGAATPVTAGHPAGVFTWNPPTALVVALSDLLDRGRLQS